MFEGIKKMFSGRKGGEKAPTPESRESSKSFSSIEIPSSLIGETYGEAERVLKARYGNRLATVKDIQHIKKNPDCYPHLQDPKVWHMAFGSILRMNSYPYVPFLRWNGHRRRFDDIENSFELRTDGHDRVLLRD